MEKNLEKKEDNLNETINHKKEQSKVIIIISIFLIFLIVVFIIVWMVSSNSQKSFTYRGIDFRIVNEIAPYQTVIPGIMPDQITGKATQRDYTFYLRNDPRTLESIPFIGEATFTQDVVFNATGNLTCGGKGSVGVQTLANLYTAIGAKVIKDPEGFCDLLGQFTFIQLEESYETKIEQTGPSCYLIKVSNCETLEATERFMVENIVEINKKYEESKSA